MDLLTRLEEAILIAVLMLNEEAYGVPINRVVSQVFKKSYTMGGLYFALDQLVRKEYLRKWSAHPRAERGGRRRTYYRPTPEGEEALKAVRNHQIRLWEALPDFSSGIKA